MEQVYDSKLPQRTELIHMVMTHVCTGMNLIGIEVGACSLGIRHSSGQDWVLCTRVQEMPHSYQAGHGLVPP